MKCKVQVVIETETGDQVQQVACLERDSARLEEIGLTLAEAKSLVAGIQKVLVEEQVGRYVEDHRICSHCGKALPHKGKHRVAFYTLFGNLEVQSPRLFHCPCQPHETNTFSPLAELLKEHTAPERLYLETKWGSLISFEMTARLLAEVLPLEGQVNAVSVHNHLHQIAERGESELGEEQVSFIDGCPREWAALPRPPAPLTVGIDGGYVRSWEEKQTHFEAIVGKSMPEEGENKCFAYVQTFDRKPKRRLFELLKSQGMQFNQQVTFLSDGGDDVRDLQMYLNPEAEHLLDWFHVTMRLTVMGQHAKGLPEKAGEEEEEYALRAEAGKLLERIKHFLWHGNVFRALEEIEDVETLLGNQEKLNEPGQKLAKAMGEFRTYITANQRFIPNYGERWRNEDT
ncbi:MAG: ISKra4 family transposase, partial [Terriglobia bacterium]